MFRAKPLDARVHAFVHAAATLLVLLVVFLAVNWSRMPDGFGGFLALRITVKNLMVTALFLLGSALSFRVSGLPKPAYAAPFWKELLRVTEACAATSVIALLFPLTS